VHRVPPTSVSPTSLTPRQPTQAAAQYLTAPVADSPDYEGHGRRVATLLAQYTFEDWQAAVAFEPSSVAECRAQQALLAAFAVLCAETQGQHIETYVRQPDTPVSALHPMRDNLKLLRDADAAPDAPGGDALASETSDEQNLTG